MVLMCPVRSIRLAVWKFVAEVMVEPKFFPKPIKTVNLVEYLNPSNVGIIAKAKFWWESSSLRRVIP